MTYGPYDPPISWNLVNGQKPLPSLKAHNVEPLPWTKSFQTNELEIKYDHDKVNDSTWLIHISFQLNIV